MKAKTEERAACLVVVAGLLLFFVGMWWFWPPVALCFAGVMVLVLGIGGLLTVADRKDRKKK